MGHPEPPGGSPPQRPGSSDPVGVAQSSLNYRLKPAAVCSKVNGLRSEIDGLAAWLRLSAHATTTSFTQEGRPLQTSTTMSAVPDVALARVMNLSAMVIGRLPTPSRSEVVYRSRVYIRTLRARECDWESHLDIHFAICNLLRIAAWKRLDFLSHEAHNSRECIQIPGGVSLPEWYGVRTALTGVSVPAWSERDRFMFDYQDIGKVGVRKWLQLAKRYARGLDPFVSLLDLEGATIDAGIAQLGIAFEAIGYELFQERGKSENAANKKPVVDRVDLLVQDVSRTLSFQPSTFGGRFAESYNSVKHANRPQIDPALKQEHFQQGVELVRKWIAYRLGVSAQTLRSAG
ncbi:ApeA N-terminal domain 1-containing protein [Tessaracoccus sp.]|uniref:ApeA N-terminal domain 1-containing protein n=1 Tax=Tessaracoccus sp. TaxID=1971211 RepID=UPI00344E7A39